LELQDQKKKTESLKRNIERANDYMKSIASKHEEMDRRIEEMQFLLSETNPE
jgi:hypothetical protein